MPASGLPIAPGADRFAPRAGARQASPASLEACPLSARPPGRLRRRSLTDRNARLAVCRLAGIGDGKAPLCGALHNGAYVEALFM